MLENKILFELEDPTHVTDKRPTADFRPPDIHLKEEESKEGTPPPSRIKSEMVVSKDE